MVWVRYFKVKEILNLQKQKIAKTLCPKIKQKQ